EYPACLGGADMPFAPSRRRTRTGLAWWYVLACALIAGRGSGAAGYTTAPGFAVSDFATGFANGLCSFGGCGPIGLTFAIEGNLFVVETVAGNLFKFPPTGGIASVSTQVAVIGGYPTGLTFAGASQLLVERAAYGDILLLNPSDGSLVHTVANLAPDTSG